MSYAQYSYDGPVLEFDRVISTRWTGVTFAPSANKARSNLAYQFRQQFGKQARTKITLPGKITRVDGEENKQ
jgi:hypothetical protein